MYYTLGAVKKEGHLVAWGHRRNHTTQLCRDYNNPSYSLKLAAMGPWKSMILVKLYVATSHDRYRPQQVANRKRNPLKYYNLARWLGSMIHVWGTNKAYFQVYSLAVNVSVVSHPDPMDVIEISQRFWGVLTGFQEISVRYSLRS